MAYFKGENYGKALSIGRILLKKEPKSVAVLSLCGVCAIKLGDMRQAAKYYSRLVKLDPRDASGWSSLGFSYFTIGEYKRARRAYGRASLNEPDNIEHVLNHALSLVADGDLQRACKRFSSALELNPASRRALQGMANVLRAQSRPFEAVRYLERLAENEGADDPVLWVEYAEVTLRITDVPRTLNAIARAGELDITEPELESRIAMIWNELGESDKALSAIGRALAIAPDDRDFLNDAASIYRECGEREKASETYFRIISRTPGYANAYIGLCQLRKFTPGNQQDAVLVSQMQHALTLECEDPALIHFALGKAFDDLDDVEQAWHHFKRGNDLRRSERRYSLQADVARVGKRKEMFPPGCIQGPSKAIPPETVSPIFIVGMPRSGTTLVEQIIGAHPDVTPCGELMLLVHILTDRLGDGLVQSDPNCWHEIGELYRTRVSALAGARNRITDKLPFNFFNIGAILNALPDARVIILRRHPLATGLSCYKTPFASGLDFSYDLASIGRFHNLCNEMCAYWLSIAPQRLLEVVYEDLVQDLSGGIRNILAYCGLEYHPDCERFHEKRRRIGTASFMQANQPVYTSSLDRWRAYEAQLAPIARVVQ